MELKQFPSFLCLLIFGLGLAVFVFGAVDLEKKCAFEEIDKECQNLSPLDCQALLKECLNFYQEKAKTYETKISQTKNKEKTLQNKIYLLKNQIKKYQNEIYQSNLIIKDLSLQIKDTQTSIEKTSLKIEETKEKLAQILRLIYQEDQKSVLEIALSEEKLSDFFDNLTALEALSAKNQELLTNIKQLKTDLEKEQQLLNNEKEGLERQNLIKALRKKENEELKKEHEALLKKTKGKESLYRAYLKEVQKKAQEIRKRIFELAQVPQSEAPSYEEAYTLAKNVEMVTGVRPAFLLGLLEVESAIGKNVGQCNCKSNSYCRHPEIGWKKVMPKKQWDSFLKITKELGLDPNTTPVSCALDGGKVQWGGAMGPAQFMPNTWLNLGYKKRVEKITGVKPANPWRIKDAFLAAGLYLADWKAASQKLKDEIGAATAYLCGTNYMTKSCKRAGGKWYRQLVMEKASQWQKWIDQGVFNQ
jgi:peptidoglycan hydrolase CwlO-like protein